LHSPSSPACHCCGNRWDRRQSWTAVWTRKRVMNSRPYNTNTTMFFLFWLPFYCIKFLKFNSHLYILHFNKYEKDEGTVGALYKYLHTSGCRIFHTYSAVKKLILLRKHSEGWSIYLGCITGRKFLYCIEALRDYFLCVFAKLRKTPMRLVMSVCPSVLLFAWNNSAPTGRIFMKFDIWIFFADLSRDFKFY